MEPHGPHRRGAFLDNFVEVEGSHPRPYRRGVPARLNYYIHYFFIIFSLIYLD